MADERLDLGIAQTQRILDNQLSSVDSIQTKIGVLLGFVSASLALLFSFGYAWVSAHVVIAAVSAAALLASVVILGISLMLEDYNTAPDPTWLVNLINKGTSTDLLKEDVIGAFWKAFDKNRLLIFNRFRLTNWAILLWVIGLGVFVIGVLVT